MSQITLTHKIYEHAINYRFEEKLHDTNKKFTSINIQNIIIKIIINLMYGSF